MPIEAELDTGSFGLRVFAAVVTPDAYTATDMRRTYAFSGGEKFEGFLASSSVAVGPARTDTPLFIMVIDHISCVDSKPHCYSSRVKPEEYGIAGGGVPNKGFKAILGVSLRRAATDDSALNPLSLIGGGDWIVSLPQPGGSEAGHLIIDPDASDRAGFAPLQLKTEGAVSGNHLAGWADASLPGCLVGGDGRRFCGDTIFDSGAPGVSIGSPDVSKSGGYGADKAVKLEIGGADGPVSIPFITGHDNASRVVLHPPQRGSDTRISAGTLPFFSYDVLYDSKMGTMGFRRRVPQAPL